MDEFESLLEQLNIPSSSPTRTIGGVVDFNPQQQKHSLLKRWLQYRGVTLPLSDDDLFTFTTNELARRGKPFFGFVDFNPQDASLEFLKTWLSYFGIAGDDTKDKPWFVKQTKSIQHILRDLSKKESVLQKFEKLIELREEMKRKAHKISTLNLLLQRVVNEEQDAIVSSSLAQPEQNKVWFLKQVLARALDASAVATPLFFYQLTPKRKSHQNEKLTFKEAIISEIPKAATKTLAMSAFQSSLAEAVMKDLDKGPLPIEVTKELARTYLKSHPKAMQILTGVVLPGFSNIMTKVLSTKEK